MDRAKELAFIDEIAVHLVAGETSRADEPLRVPTEQLLGEQRVEDEAAVLFTQFPLVIAPSAAVKNPGDFVVETVADRSVLVVRGPDGSVQCFANVCRHRGNQLCVEPSGSARMFTCGYHAWSYNLDGSCRSMVDPAAFQGLDPTDHGLIEYPTQERHGFIWVLLDPDGEIDVAASLGAEFDTEIGGYEPHTKHLYRETGSELAFNWKLGVNTFQELFHVAYLHKNSIGDLFVGNRSTFDSYAPHQRITVIRTTFAEMAAGPVEERNLFPHCTIVYLLFPSTLLIWQLDHVELWQFTPDAADRYSSWARLWLLTAEKADTDSAQRHWDRNWDFTIKTVFGEDFPAQEAIQTNLRSGVLDSVLYGRNEIGLQDFYTQVSNALSS